MNPLLTPLPATLSAKLTAASAQAADGMAAEQAEAMGELQLVPPLTAPTLPQAILCVSGRQRSAGALRRAWL